MKIGLLGLGNIGLGVFEHLSRRGDIAVKRILSRRKHPGFESIETFDYNDILNDPEIDTVVELIGGIEPAREYTLGALKAGKNVVSANKLLLAHHMEEVLQAAHENNVIYKFDASVGGSIPFLFNVMRHRNADHITALFGIVNGTTNLILDTMQTTPRSFDDVLLQAQNEGYAEADPSSDIDGIDSQCKICVASAMGYQRYVRPEQVHTEGIRYISGADIIYFKQLGYVCRLIAHSALADEENTLHAYVEPTLVPADAPEAAVHLNNNMIGIAGDYIGLQHFQGQGAGKNPTAFAVVLSLTDIIDGIYPKRDHMPRGYAIVDNHAVTHRYYLRTAAKIDIPAKKLGACGDGTAYLTEPISVQSMHEMAAHLRSEDSKLFFAGIRA